MKKCIKEWLEYLNAIKVHNKKIEVEQHKVLRLADRKDSEIIEQAEEDYRNAMTIFNKKSMLFKLTHAIPTRNQLVEANQFRGMYYDLEAKKHKPCFEGFMSFLANGNELLDSVILKGQNE